MELVSRSQIDTLTWETLVKESVQGSFYHHLEWIDACCAGLPSFHPWFLVKTDGQGRYLLGFPFVASTKFGLRRNHSLPFGTYGGLVLSPQADQGQKEYYAAVCVRGMSGPTVIDQSLVDFHGLADWRRYGFNEVTLTTHISDMVEYAKYPAHLHKRGAIQARNQGIEVRALSGKEDIASCYGLIAERNRRLGQPNKYPLSLYQSIYQHVGPSGNLWWRLAFRDGHLLGFTISFIHQEEIYYWEGASSRERDGLRPSDALFTDLFNTALERRLKRVNLGASPPGAMGLLRYKQAWGARPFEYKAYFKTIPWLGLLRRLRKK